MSAFIQLTEAVARLGMKVDARLARAPGHGRRRGVALVVVFTTIAILATSVIEYVYNTRVNLYLAQNQRDEVKAYFLARSGVNLQRLALAFQGELETQGGMMGRAMSRSNFQLWQYLDLLLPTFSSGSLAAEGFGEVNLVESGATGFGTLQGAIEFGRPVPEEGKINLNAFASRELNQQTLQALCTLLMPPAYDELLGSARDREVANRFEVVAAIIDHIDPDTNRMTLDANCQLRGAGAGDEGARYRDVTWLPKNEPLVTLDELRLVPGVTDAFMAQFRENLTVYPVAGEFYVNLQNAQGFAGFLCGHILGGTPDMNPCAMPVIAEQVGYIAVALEGWVQFFSNPFNVLNMWMGSGSMGPDMMSGALANGQMMAFRTNRDFLSVLNLMMTNPEIALYFMSFADPMRAQLFGMQMMMGMPGMAPQLAVSFDESRMVRAISTDVPRVFTVQSTGVYGGASRTIRAVVDQRNQGRLLYWREL